MGSRKRSMRCLEAAHRAADEDGSQLAKWYARTTRCTTMFLLDNDFPGCLDSARGLEADWYAAGRGEGWETDVVRHFMLASQQMMGQMAALGTRVEELVTAARRTGDRFQEVSLRVRFAVRHLLVDRPDVADEDITDALSSWQPSADTFGNQRAWALWTRTRVVLYRRDFGQLEELVGADWVRMRRALIGRVPAMQVEWFHAYGTYLIGKAIDARTHGRASEAAALFRRTLRLAAKVGGMKFPAAPGVQHMLEAGVACARGGDMVAKLRTAVESSTARDFHVYVPFIKRRLGEALGGTEGDEMVKAADLESKTQGWQVPEHGAQLVLPQA
jgi:hypothetical protein